MANIIKFNINIGLFGVYGLASSHSDGFLVH